MVSSELTKFLISIWEKEGIAKDWCDLVILLIYMKDGRFSCKNPNGISLANIESELLAGVIHRRFSCTLISEGGEWNENKLCGNMRSAL